jgi:hypothetical protein
MIVMLVNVEKLSFKNADNIVYKSCYYQISVRQQIFYDQLHLLRKCQKDLYSNTVRNHLFGLRGSQSTQWLTIKDRPLADTFAKWIPLDCLVYSASARRPAIHRWCNRFSSKCLSWTRMKHLKLLFPHRIGNEKPVALNFARICRGIFRFCASINMFPNPFVHIWINDT